MWPPAAMFEPVEGARIRVNEPGFGRGEPDRIEQQSYGGNVPFYQETHVYEVSHEEEKKRVQREEDGLGKEKTEDEE